MTTVRRKNGYKVTATEEWYRLLIAKNGKTIARSSETYKTKRAAVASIKVASDIMRFVAPGSYFDHTKSGEQVVY